MACIQTDAANSELCTLGRTALGYQPELAAKEVCPWNERFHFGLPPQSQYRKSLGWFNRALLILIATNGSAIGYT